MVIPKYIRAKLLREASLAQEIARLSSEAEAWFQKQGFTVEELRSGNGCSLEEFEYGTATEETLDQLEDYLSLVEVDHVLQTKKAKPEIPEEYKWKFNKNGAGARTVSPVGIELEGKRLEEIACPCCGQKKLRLMRFDPDDARGPDMPDYQVGCDECDWICHGTISSDCGDAIASFKSWMEAFILLGRPKDRVNEDLDAEFGQFQEEKE